MATQDHSDSRTLAPSLPQRKPLPLWVSSKDPVLAHLLSMKAHDEALANYDTGEAVLGHWERLEQAIVEVAIASAEPEDPEIEAKRDYFTELELLYELRFPAIKDGCVLEFLTHIALRTAGAMHERWATSKASTQPTPTPSPTVAANPEGGNPDRTASEIAAIAVSDHDCPGVHG